MPFGSGQGGRFALSGRAISDIEGIQADLRRAVRGEVAFDPGTRALYSTAACMYRVQPLGVVAPRDADDVAAVVAYCRENHIPITPRGAGSGLAGQALGDGIILDFTPHMNRLLGAADDHVWVEPGLICDELNAALAPRGLYFPPDPSSAGYCSLGGMIANNSAGSHSVKYGTTIDYVEELKVILPGGATAHLRPYELDGPAWERLAAEETREAQIHRDVRFVVEANSDLIRAHQPRTTKNACGYRLERVLSGRSLNLSKLVCGSEGTLAIVLAARLRIAAVPRVRKLALLHFADLASAGQAVLEILAMGPSSIEIQEQHAVDVVRSGRPELAEFLPEPGHAVLFVEFDGDDDAVASGQMRRMRERVCEELHLAARYVEPATQAEVQKLWAIRKATLPLLYNLPGPKRIITAIEDVTVPPDRIPAYIDGLFRIFARHGVEAALFGHAAQGNFHVRPILDLHDPAEVRKMRALADEVFDFTATLGGIPSGEHGDGIVRTEYLGKVYGPLLPLFAQVKRIFDPEGILNPGKKVPDPRHPWSLTTNLRFDPGYGTLPLPQHLHWEGEAPAEPPPPVPRSACPTVPAQSTAGQASRGTAWAAEAERCHGCATCRTLPVSQTRMCPVFKATGLEEASPRAKANLLREIAAGRLAGAEAARQLARVSELCLLCGSCKLECPSKVDVPKLMLEAKARAAAERAPKLWRWLFARLDALGRWAVPFAPLANGANRFGPSRWFLEKLAHIDRHRPLPAIARRPLRKRLGMGQIGPIRPIRPIVYFPDLFAELNDPTLGEALIRLLGRAGIEVVLPPVKSCGILAMSCGNAKAAIRTIRHNLAELRDYARQGFDILFTEPTALLCLRETYGDYVADDAAREVAAHCRDAVEYLLPLRQAGKLPLGVADPATGGPPVATRKLTLGYHTPCHTRALGLGSAAPKLLADIPGLKIVPIDEGCCGMAGSAGLRREQYDLSMRIGRKLFERLGGNELDGAVTECSACRMQIEHGTGKPAYHPIHLLAHAILGADLPP